MARSVIANQRGFTLIEMSIVLVIIGLIVGGILKGQELIESSRQKNMISQIDRLRSGTTAFVDRFRSLPGDFNRISVLPSGSLLGTTGGNDNGVIGAQQTTVATMSSMAAIVAGSSENVKYFNHLIVSNLAGAGSATNESVNPACYSGLCATPSPLPSSAFPSSGVTISYGTHEGGTNGAATGQPDARQAHWLLVSRFKTSGSFAGGATDGVISPARAFQLDQKYDDGGAGSGNLRTGFTPTTCGTTSTDYTASNVTDLCNLMFTLD